MFGSAGAEWLAEGSDLPAAGSGIFSRAELAPPLGAERTVRVRLPLPADGTSPFWTLFMPALAAVNGFEEHPELLDGCAMIACTPLEVLARDARVAWLRVRVEDAVRAADAVARFPPSAAGSLGHLLPFSTTATLFRAESGGLSYYAWSWEGDVGCWAVCADGGQGKALVLYGEWSFDQDDVALGYRPLSPSEIAALAAVWA